MKGQRYTHEHFEAICEFLDSHAGCTARDVGEGVYPHFHVSSSSLPRIKRSARMRDWARNILRVLETEGHVRKYQVGHVLCYYLVDEDADDDIREEVRKMHQDPDYSIIQRIDVGEAGDV